jgi:hypothetical protein
VPLAALLLWASSGRWTERPHIFSSLLLVTYAYIFFRYRLGRLRARWLMVIPALQMVWVNLHGGHIQGLAVVVIFAMGEAYHWVRARSLTQSAEPALSRADVLRLAALVPACVAASLITPYGYHLLLFPFEQVGRGAIMGIVGEWMPPYRGTYYSPKYWAYLLLLGVLGTAWTAKGGTLVSKIRGTLGLLWLAVAGFCMLVPFRRVVDPVPLSPEELALASMLYGLLGLFIVFIVASWRQVDVSQAGLIGMVYVLSVRHNRCIDDAALLLFPLCAASASAYVDMRWRSVPRPWWAQPATLVASLALVLALAGVTLMHPEVRGMLGQRGFGVSPWHPTAAVDYVARSQLARHAFTSMSTGPLLIWRLYPQVRVSTDTRDHVYGEQLFMEHLNAQQDPDAMEAFLARYPVDFLLMTFDTDMTETVFVALLIWGWKPVYRDSLYFIMVSPQTAAGHATDRSQHEHP